VTRLLNCSVRSASATMGCILGNSGCHELYYLRIGKPFKFSIVLSTFPANRPVCPKVWVRSVQGEIQSLQLKIR
jgi:hypothetical protein